VNQFSSAALRLVSPANDLCAYRNLLQYSPLDFLNAAAVDCSITCKYARRLVADVV